MQTFLFMYTGSLFQSHVCVKCGNILSPTFKKQSAELEQLNYGRKKWICQLCGESANVKQIVVPHVLKYLLAELSAMNIRVTFKVK